MSTVARPRLMTFEEFLKLPDNGTDRMLINGELREQTMTLRNRHHSRSESKVAKVLDNWLDTQPEPRGLVVSGEAGFLIRRNPDAAVGIDVAYVSAEVAARNPDGPYFDGPPVLAVEILSPSDTTEAIDEKIRLYLECGVAAVWVLHPRFRTVTVYRRDVPPSLFNDTQELADPALLPGFATPVARLF